MAKIAKPKGTKGKPSSQTTDNLNDREEELAPLNFKVSRSFKHEFRTYASERNITMRELLVRMFEDYRDSK